MEPRLLILETSGRVGQVAVAEGAVVRRQCRLEESRRHARDLAPAVAELLKAEGWKPSDVQGVIVSRGPGSYTGLRVGLMSAKAFAYATGCALLAVDTFAAVALQAPPEALAVDVLADAQQDKVYAQSFRRPAAGAPLEAASELAIRPFPEWLARLDDGVWVTGPGLGGKEQRLPAAARVVAAEQWDPRAESLLRLGLPRHLRGERDDLWAVEPFYLRPSSAEEKWQQRTSPGG